MERMKAKAAAAGKVVKHVVAKSLIIWEVKPWEEETNLDDLAKKILDIKIDGLEWKTEYKKEPVAYGIFKLVIGVAGLSQICDSLSVSQIGDREDFCAQDDQVHAGDVGLLLRLRYGFHTQSHVDDVPHR
jgi:elongation factor 1-beta